MRRSDGCRSESVSHAEQGGPGFDIARLDPGAGESAAQSRAEQVLPLVGHWGQVPFGMRQSSPGVVNQVSSMNRPVMYAIAAR